MKKVLALITILLLASCAKKDYAEIIRECTAEAKRNYPEQMEPRVVNDIRFIPAPSGISNCINIGITSTCYSGQTMQPIPISEIRYEDANRVIRVSTVKQCVKRVCFEQYGNEQCETPTKNGVEN